MELTMTEQRYRAVLEVGAGVPVTEVAERFGVSRQAVHRWIGWYREGASTAWPTVRIARMVIRRRPVQRSKRLSVSCVGVIPGGVSGVCISSWAGWAVPVRCRR